VSARLDVAAGLAAPAAVDADAGPDYRTGVRAVGT
jgi:hypothetical protein